MIDPRDLAIQDFTYELPEEKIAQFPLSKRSDSKLLVFDSERTIHHHHFYDLPELIEENSLLIMNNTKVVQARLIFYKSTGAKIEIFCMEPLNKIPLEQAFQSRQKVQWLCMIGNAKKWKDELLTAEFIANGIGGKLTAKKIIDQNELTVIEFEWFSDLSFAEVLSFSGLLPLPPYMKRDAVESDKEAYNTVYAKNIGSVAAPTSGLHFTAEIFNKLNEKNIQTNYLTLHVGAGTFKPVKSLTMADHTMHEEQVSISFNTIKNLRDAIGKRKIIAVGTTTSRTLESIYWHSVDLMRNENSNPEMNISQWQPYENNTKLPSAEEALIFLYDWMKKNQLKSLSGSTQIIIVPGYQFKIIDALLTNFHQPQSTLLLLVSALIGDDWKNIYQSALENNYRFLSYGDSSLLFKQK